MYEDQYAQQQGQPPPQGYSPLLEPPTPPNPEPDFFRYRIEGSDILESLEHQLKGEVWITLPDGGGKWDVKFKQELTDEGVSDVLNIVYSFGLNKNVILGNLTHEEIYERCNVIWKELARYFFLRGQVIGVTPYNRSMLIKKIVFIIHSGLSRSEMGREASQISTASQKVEHTYVDNTPKSGIGNPLAPVKNLFARGHR